MRGRCGRRGYMRAKWGVRMHLPALQNLRGKEMAELTQGEKALLDALVYIDSGDTWNRTSNTRLIDIVKELDTSPDGASGGMNDDECRAILQAIEKSPNLSQLELVRNEELDYKKFSDARILTFKNDDTAVVIFHGTEGDQEFKDNLDGAFTSDTDAQKGALNYIDQLHDKMGFDKISVIGHSKGGNKAIYTAVLSDYVIDCTAFDAQGFSPEFMAKYYRQIKNKKNNITLISSDKSFVNALLFQIAGTIQYLSTEGLSGIETGLGPLLYHKPNIYFMFNDKGKIIFDENGDVQLREESKRAIIPDMINLVTEMITTGYWIVKNGSELLQIVVSEIINGTDPLALSLRIGGLLVAALPGLSEGVSEILTSVKKLFGLEDGIDVGRMMEVVALGLAIQVAAHIILSPGFLIMAAKAVATVVVVWAVVKILEQVIPALINAGIETAKAIGLAVGMAASWIGEQLANIGKAIAEGFCNAIDNAVKLGQMAADAANAVKEAISNAVKMFLSEAGKFFENIGKGVKNWIDGVFGSTGSAIQYAQNINVTMSRIEEMQRHISNLRQCYTNARGTTNNASSTVNRVYGYYHESYVRSCCRDIQNNLKKAQNYISAAEQELDRKRRALAAAAESYHRADQEAVGIVRDYT